MHVRDHVVSKWEELAEELGLDDEEDVSKELDKIKEKYKDDNKKAAFEVLKLWVNYYKTAATWQTLMDALQGTSLQEAVNSIKKYLSGKQHHDHPVLLSLLKMTIS